MPNYRNDTIVVGYDPKICIHAGECVRGLPSVFNVSEKPWIAANGVAANAIAEQVVSRAPKALESPIVAQRQIFDTRGLRN